MSCILSFLKDFFYIAKGKLRERDRAREIERELERKRDK